MIVPNAINEIGDVPEKIRLDEEYLLDRLSHSPDGATILNVVQVINTSVERIRMDNLYRELSYTQRFLDMKFADRVGIIPKGVGADYTFPADLLAKGQNGNTKHFSCRF